MTHPDAAWTIYYLSPDGVEGEPCRHWSNRSRVGSTSRYSRMILVDACSRCGRILRCAEDLSWREYDWMRRINRRLERKLGEGHGEEAGG